MALAPAASKRRSTMRTARLVMNGRGCNISLNFPLGEKFFGRAELLHGVEKLVVVRGQRLQLMN